MRKINLYCGITVEKKVGLEYHPVTQFNRAKEEIDITLMGNENYTIELFSNSPDFVSAIFYLAHDNDIIVELFLNGVSCGNDIEKIFEDFNRFYDLLRGNDDMDFEFDI